MQDAGAATLAATNRPSAADALPEAFLSKVRLLPTGCLEWTAGTCNTGYGRYGRRSRAHRFAYERLVGAVPDGMELDHLCRNRRCVRPDHLQPVTHTENIRRGAVTKLNREQAEAIRRDPRTGQAIARDYGVSQSHVSRIKRGVNWADA